MRHTFVGRLYLILSVFLMIGVFAVGTAAAAAPVQRVLSKTGIEAWLIEDHTNPIISLNLAFRGGAIAEPKGQEGLAQFVAATLDEGAGDLDSQAFQGELDDLAISLGFSASDDLFTGSLTTLSENRDRAFELLSLALTKPRFDDDAVERLRRQLVSSVEQSLTEPNEIASRALSRELFGDHPYGRSSAGTPESLAAITIDNLRQFARQRLAKDNLIIGVVGDITSAELALLLDKTFGGLPDQSQTLEAQDIAPSAKAKTIVIDKAVPQSVISFAQPGLKREHPDFYAATVLNYIFGGGGFVSRLYNEIREKRGLVYSVGTGLVPRDYAGLIAGRAATQNKRAGETVSVLKAEWQRLREKGVTAEELDAAKTYLIGSFPLRFSSSGGISAMLMAMQAENLGIDYLDRRNGLIEAVTLSQVNRLARDLINLDQLTIVVVGQPEGLSSD